MKEVVGSGFLILGAGGAAFFVVFEVECFRFMGKREREEGNDLLTHTHTHCQRVYMYFLIHCVQEGRNKRKEKKRHVPD